MASRVAHTIILDQKRYYIQSLKTFLPSTAIPKLIAFNKSSFIPATALPWKNSTFNDEDLHNVCQAYAQADDVWCSSFLSLILLAQPSGTKCDVKSNKVICVDGQKKKLPNGPLVIEKATGQIFRVAKLVPDTHAAFIIATIPQFNKDPSSNYHELPKKIAIPSRLYFDANDDKPLAGLRVGVKDVIALKGLRTGFGSHAWRETYGPEDFTAACVQRLVDAGAVVVGKVVTSELAEGVEAGEWTQGVCPYNPRGDGQQKASSSSTGSAVAAAAYEWLDVTIGTDTGGSIRHPAGVNGLFGQRPSHGIMDLKGVLAATDLFNTVGIFARSAELFVKVGSYLTKSEERIPKDLTANHRKYTLLYPVRSAPSQDPDYAKQQKWFPHPEADPSTWSDAEKQMEAVVLKMERELDCRRIPFNIYEVWGATPPKGQPRSLDEATGQIYGDITTSSACATAVDQFIADFAAANKGEQPEISEVVKRRLDYGRNLPNDKIAAALEATSAFRQWMETTLFGSYDQDTTTLMIFPQSYGRPDYREDGTRWNGNLFIEAFSIYAFGYLCGCPDYTIPIGETPYHSRVTEKTEYLPVSLSLVGKPGTDQELFEVVEILHASGVVSDVMAGSRMYPGQMISNDSLVTEAAFA